VRRFACLLVTLPLLLVGMTASPVMASATKTAYFWTAAYGSCLVSYLPEFMDGTGTWTPSHVGLAMGGVSFGGKASVTEYTFPWPGEWYEVVPGTLKAYGWVTASWSKEGVKYAIRLLIYSIPVEGHGYLLEPEQDILIFGGMPPPIMLEYIGFVVAVSNAGSQTTAVQGNCGFMVVPGSPIGMPPDVWMAHWHFNHLVDGTTIELTWVEEPTTATITLDDGSSVTISIPAALLFKHEVIVL